MLDTAANRALVLANGLASASVVAVDLSSGNCTVISGGGSGGLSSRPHLDLWAIALDTAANRALLVAENSTVVVAVDLSSGNTTVIRSESAGSRSVFVGQGGVALDTAANRALVVDSDLGAVVAVDLSSGNRIVISDSSTGSGTPLGLLTGIALDTAANRALVVDRDLDAVVAVDLSSGNRRIVSQ